MVRTRLLGPVAWTGWVALEPDPVERVRLHREVPVIAVVTGTSPPPPMGVSRLGEARVPKAAGMLRSGVPAIFLASYSHQGHASHLQVWHEGNAVTAPVPTGVVTTSVGNAGGPVRMMTDPGDCFRHP